MRLAMIAATLFACDRSAENPCEELHRQVPEGVQLASEPARCQELLNFAASTAKRYGMDFRTWIETVAAQRVTLVLDSIHALTEGAWTPVTFTREPETIPCENGLLGVDALSVNSNLSSILRAPPDTIYVSLSIEVSAESIATVRVYQDFDCDKTPAVMELSGRYQRGRSAFTGGWELRSSTSPEIDE
jgi:hypothetical protein